MDDNEICKNDSEYSISIEDLASVLIHSNYQDKT